MPSVAAASLEYDVFSAATISRHERQRPAHVVGGDRVVGRLLGGRDDARRLRM